MQIQDQLSQIQSLYHRYACDLQKPTHMQAAQIDVIAENCFSEKKK